MWYLTACDTSREACDTWRLDTWLLDTWQRNTWLFDSWWLEIWQLDTGGWSPHKSYSHQHSNPDHWGGTNQYPGRQVHVPNVYECHQMWTALGDICFYTTRKQPNLTYPRASVPIWQHPLHAHLGGYTSRPGCIDRNPGRHATMPWTC